MSIINFGHFTSFLYPKLNQKFLNFLVFKVFVGKITKNGKKLKSLNFAYSVLLNLRNNFLLKNKSNPELLRKIDGALIFFLAIKTILPVFRIVVKRVGGSIYHLPTPLIKPKNAITRGLKNLIFNSVHRPGFSLISKLTFEIVDSAKKKSVTFLNKRLDYKTGFRGIPFVRYLIRKTYRIKYNNYKFLKKNIGKNINSNQLIKSEFNFSTNKNFKGQIFTKYNSKEFRRDVNNYYKKAEVRDNLLKRKKNDIGYYYLNLKNYYFNFRSKNYYY